MNEKAKTSGLIPAMRIVIALSLLCFLLSGCAIFEEDPEIHIDSVCRDKRYNGISYFRTGMAELELRDVGIMSVNGKPAKIGPKDNVMQRYMGMLTILDFQSKFDYCNAEFPIGQKIELVAVPLIVTSKVIDPNPIQPRYSYAWHSGKFYPLTVTFEKGYTYDLSELKVLRNGQEYHFPYVDRWHNHTDDVIVASPAANLIGLTYQQAYAYAKALGNKKYSVRQLKAMRQKMLKETGYHAP